MVDVGSRLFKGGLEGWDMDQFGQRVDIAEESVPEIETMLIWGVREGGLKRVSAEDIGIIAIGGLCIACGVARVVLTVVNIILDLGVVSDQAKMRRTGPVGTNLFCDSRPQITGQH